MLPTLRYRRSLPGELRGLFQLARPKPVLPAIASIAAVLVELAWAWESQALGTPRTLPLSTPLRLRQLLGRRRGRRRREDGQAGCWCWC